MLKALLFLVCGGVQFRAGHTRKGALLFISFVSSAFVALFYLSHMHSARELALGGLGLSLNVLLLFYHFLDVQEHYQSSSDVRHLQSDLPKDVEPVVKIKASQNRKAAIVSDELYSRGRIAYLRGSYQEAKDCFEKLLHDDKADCDAAFQLGRVFHRLGDPRQAQRFFRQCEQSPGGGKWSEEIKKYLQHSKS